ncbi:hypothetical protein [Methanobrevibacter sp.]|uniref:hypothetical protein n=1 Tax=Methanobrevibacter sp. TaxID=66852 RepID=UPI0038660C0E
MSGETPKSSEIKRLTTPLTFKNSKAYDSNGELLKCSETLSDVRFIVEPRDNILNENEILQYAPKSKSSSKIRLKRGVGSIEDVLLIHESLPWVLGLFYVVLFCIAVPVFFSKNIVGMYILLVLAVLPLLYLYYIFNLKNYSKDTSNKVNKKRVKASQKTEVETPVKEDMGLESLKKYEKRIHDLNVLFDVKEKVVRELIQKRFEPPQITFDKFISAIDNCHKLFYAQSDAALNIINMAVEDTPRVENEIRNKIYAMKKIINQIEELTNELVINISSSDESDQEVKNLLEDMENLVDSVKDYDGD